MAELAKLPQLHCKFSGLLTEMPAHSDLGPTAVAAMLQPLWDALLEDFKPQRIMWGSDWPVLTLASNYATWLDVSHTLINPLTSDEQQQIWHKAATRFYSLE